MLKFRIDWYITHTKNLGSRGTNRLLENFNDRVLLCEKKYLCHFSIAIQLLLQLLFFVLDIWL